jgi:hypothetical protein
MQNILAVEVCDEGGLANLEAYLTNLRRKSASDGFPSDVIVLAGGLERPGNSVVASRAGEAPFLWDCSRPAYAMLLHPVDQRRSLHP